MPNGGTKTPIDAGMLARASNAWRALTDELQAITTGWFAPLSPPVPVVPQEQQDSVRGRALDFPAGYNIRLRPRSNEPVSFEQMRALADSCDVLRLVIETRKDQIAKMSWTIGKRNNDSAKDARCQEVENFFMLPDGEHTFNDWVRMLLEDMFVVDATTIYPWLLKNGKPYRFEAIDGATIKRVIDEHGRTPAPPMPAYQQVLKGVVAVDYTCDELIYAPRNARIHKIYGYSPVEQIILTVNIAIRRAVSQLQYYTDGSTPDLLFQVPQNWSNQQIKDFSEYWNNQLSGQTAERRKTMFVPGGVAPLNTREAILKDPYDEWLARIVCYAFSVSPTPFIKETNRATAQTAQEAATEEGLFPIMFWLKQIIDKLIWRYFGYTDLEFKWGDQDATNPLDQVKIDDTNVRNGTATINEIRSSRGLPPIEGGDVAMVLTSTGYVPVTPQLEQNATQIDAQGESGEAQNEAPGNEVMDQNAKIYKRLKVLVKKSKKVAPINREDPDYKKQVDELSKSVYIVLQKQVHKLVGSLGDMVKLKKAKKDDNNDDNEYPNPIDDLDWSGWDDIAPAVEGSLESVATKGVADAATQIDMDDDKALSLANKDAIDYAKNRAAQLIGKQVDDNGDVIDNPDAEYSIEDATREMVRGDVVKALEQGTSSDDLSAILQGSYAFSESRATTIARTEVAKAAVQGNMALYKRSGQVAGLQWSTAAGCCDDCTDLDKEVVALGDAFSDGSDGPPQHPNCRCDVIPILTDDDEPDVSED